MKRLYFVILAITAIAGGATMYFMHDMGQVQISFAQYSFETSLLIAGSGLLGVLLGVLLLDYTFGLLSRLASSFGNRRKSRLADKARNSLSEGQIELTEGRFARAEKILLQNVAHSENAMLAYLSAARAAQHQGAHDRRDNYLRRAHELAPAADIAIGLTHAELQLAHHQHEQALATLTRLNELSPGHAYVLKLLATTCRKLSDWGRLRDLLPELTSSDALTGEQLRSFEIDAWRGLIDDCGRLDNVTALIQLWEQAPRYIRADPTVVEFYADRLVHAHAAGEAEQVLRNYLGNNWQESTIECYARLDVLATDKQIETAEDWLRQHPHNVWLLHALGKMCISRSLWGRARGYLEASLSVQPMPDTFLKLAQLLEDHMDEKNLAQECYRQGLHMLTGDYGDAALSKAENDFVREIRKPDLKII
jgi:HemY protein